MVHYVYYLKNPGEEFRYSLRSLEAHAPVDRVTIIGDAPRWLKGVTVLDGNPTADAANNARANAHIAARAFRDEFTICNDDFFWLRDQTEALPRWYFRTLTQHTGLYTDPRSAERRLRYINTTKYLNHKRVMMPKSYELHTPFPVIGAELDALLMESYRDPALLGPGLWRTIYGNLAPSLQSITAVQRDDVKVHTLSDFLTAVDFASTDERTIRTILPVLRDRFPSRSRWEKA